MLKFLRQYNQWILVVGGTLLLIAFLMPSAIQGLAQRSAVSGAAWATYSGGTVTGADLEQAQQELRVVEALGSQMVKALGAEKEPAHWWLLVHHAKEAGLVGGEGEGVVGEQPVIAPGKSYAYTSGAPLDTPSGFMTGTYRVRSPSGESYDIGIPMFALESPYENRRMH